MPRFAQCSPPRVFTESDRYLRRRLNASVAAPLRCEWTSVIIEITGTVPVFQLMSLSHDRCVCVFNYASDCAICNKRSEAATRHKHATQHDMQHYDEFIRMTSPLMAAHAG